MRQLPHGRAAEVHPHLAVAQGAELFEAAGESVVEPEHGGARVRYFRLKLTVTVPATLTGWPESSVGEKRHCRTAATAACCKAGGRSASASLTRPDCQRRCDDHRARRARGLRDGRVGGRGLADGLPLRMRRCHRAWGRGSRAGAEVRRRPVDGHDLHASRQAVSDTCLRRVEEAPPAGRGADDEGQEGDGDSDCEVLHDSSLQKPRPRGPGDGGGRTGRKRSTAPHCCGLEQLSCGESRQGRGEESNFLPNFYHRPAVPSFSAPRRPDRATPPRARRVQKCL